MLRNTITAEILEQLFKEHYNGLYIHAYSFLNDRELARDIVNDVFEDIWKKREKIDISHSLKAYLYNMVKNRAINHIRHLKVHKKYETYITKQQSLIDNEYIDYDKTLNKIYNAIEKLPPQGRTVFKKCFIENLSYKATAEQLGISLNTVKTHISKSLKKLRNDIPKDLLILILSLNHCNIQQNRNKLQ